jgi:hypothetical protein
MLSRQKPRISLTLNPGHVLKGLAAGGHAIALRKIVG